MVDRVPILRRRLMAAGLSDLAEAIDWDVTPSRSLWRMLPLAAQYVLLFALMWVIGLVPLFLLNEYDSAYRFIFQYLSFPIALAITIPLFGMVGAQWNKESSKYPELALFGAHRPVLYLRRFAAENPEIENVQPVRIGLFGAVKLFERIAFERAVEKAVVKVGKLVCLGDPRFQRASGRVARFYSKDQDWQKSVEALARVSSLVFIHYVPGGSVEWEVDRFLNRDNRPVAVWVESFDGSANVDFPPALASALTRFSLKRRDLGGALEGGLLLLFADKQLTWARSRATQSDFVHTFKRLLRAMKIGPERSTFTRTPNLTGTRLVERSPALFAWGTPLALLLAFFSWGWAAGRPGREFHNHVMSAYAAEEAADFAGAEAQYSSALAIGRSYGMAGVFGGRCWARAVSNTRLAEAQEDCDEARAMVERQGSRPDPRLMLGEGILALREDDYESALEHFDALLAPDPYTGKFGARARYGRALALAALGRVVEGEESRQAALTRYPDVANEFVGMPALIAAPAPETPVATPPR